MLKPPLGRVPRGDLPGRDLPAAPGHGYKSCLERGRICVCNYCGRRSVTTCVTCKYVVFRRFRRRRSLQVIHFNTSNLFAERARSSQDQGKRRGFNFKRGPGPRAAPQRERFERRRGGSGPLGHRASPTGSADPAPTAWCVENFVTTHPAAPAGPGSGRAPARARRK